MLKNKYNKTFVASGAFIPMLEVEKSPNTDEPLRQETENNFE